ncbi:hypothetical protein GXY_14123 [Novacetimonas hansenii ATCC 23769]|uniref:Uncharacterized protein n=1 Tax=Novacetimonas hansenii ATCC 23769 TaxID=714995 RepID=D5QI44_NOVHA|nr:hypothetical protein GXY_14123 [Novacetimonas hansenii ATCC 23769]
MHRHDHDFIHTAPYRVSWPNILCIYRNGYLKSSPIYCLSSSRFASTSEHVRFFLRTGLSRNSSALSPCTAAPASPVRRQYHEIIKFLVNTRLKNHYKNHEFLKKTTFRAVHYFCRGGLRISLPCIIP